MKDKRKPANMRQKLACLVAMHYGIPYDYLTGMTVEQILDLVEWDHDPVPVAVALSLGWTPERYNHPANICPRLRHDHWTKTANEDIPKIRKSDRIETAHKAFVARILAKTQDADDGEPQAQRPKRKMVSRGFQKRPHGHKYAWSKKRPRES